MRGSVRFWGGPFCTGSRVRVRVRVRVRARVSLSITFSMEFESEPFSSLAIASGSSLISSSTWLG